MKYVKILVMVNVIGITILGTIYRNISNTLVHPPLKTVLFSSKPRDLSLKYVRHRSNKSSLGNPFNPDAWDNQTSSASKHFLILYWSKIRGNMARLQRKKEYEQDQHVWPYTYVGENCPVSCELTNDRSRAKDADAFVAHARESDIYDFPPFEYLVPWILQTNENPVYTPALMNSTIMNKFNLLI